MRTRDGHAQVASRSSVITSRSGVVHKSITMVVPWSGATARVSCRYTYDWDIDNVGGNIVNKTHRNGTRDWGDLFSHSMIKFQC